MQHYLCSADYLLLLSNYEESYIFCIKHLTTTIHYPFQVVSYEHLLFSNIEIHFLWDRMTQEGTEGEWEFNLTSAAGNNTLTVIRKTMVMFIIFSAQTF